MSEELAAALLAIKLSDGSWLIDDEELRRTGTPREIRQYVECDHTHRVAEGGLNNPQNLVFRREPEHREKSKRDTTEIAKGKRYGRKHQEFQQRLLAKGEKADAAPRRRHKKMAGSRDSDVKIRMDGKAVHRKTGKPL